MTLRKEDFMSSLNPIFDEIKSNKVPKTISQPKEKPTKPRKERSDKTHNVKLPVDHILHMQLRRYVKLAYSLYMKKTGKPLSQTKFNTLLLRYVLNHQEIINWDWPYQDSKRYMHTNLLKSEHREIGGPYGLAIQKGFSERKTVYIMIKSGIQWLERGGDLEKII